MTRRGGASGKFFYLRATLWGRYYRNEEGRKRLVGGWLRIEAPRRGLTCVILGECHVYGAVETWGRWKRAGWYGVTLGLLELVETGKRDGRMVAAFRLAEHRAVAHLAARCADALRAHEGPPEAFDYRKVPDEAAGPRWPEGALPCPRCFCNPSAPCPVVLPDGCGTGTCSPAGVFDAKACSVCSGNAQKDSRTMQAPTTASEGPKGEVFGS